MKGASHFFLTCAAVAFACSANAQEAAQSAPEPVGNPGTWVTSADYPPLELRSDVTGVVKFKLTVSAEGLVTNCIVTSSSGSIALDDTACAKLTERGRFTPAKDQNGKPVAGEWANAVRWTMSQGRPAPTPGYLVVAFTVEIDGSVTDCVVERAEGTAASATTARICANFTSFLPILDNAGKPMRQRVRSMTRITHEPAP